MNFLRVCKRLAMILVIYVIGLIPVWIYFIARYFMTPSGFWENIALIVAWTILLGGIQVWILIAVTALALGIWQEC